MKRIINISKILLLVVLALSLATCKKNKFLNVNNNPNYPATVPPNLALPTCEANIAYEVGNQMNIMGSMWAQYWTQDPANGIQYSNYDKYNNVPTDNDRMWTDLYAVGVNLNYVIANDTGTRRYAGIAYLLKAYDFQLICDAWGPVPLSQALQGAANVSPAYDPELQVYDSLVVWVKQGMAIINPLANNPNGPSSPPEDLIYPNQPLSTWQKFGNTLLLRIYMRMSLKNPSFASTGINALATTAAANGGFMAGPTDDAKTIYISATYQQYPLYATYLSLNGFRQLIATTTIINLMNSLNDPRIADFFQPNANDGAYEGLIPGDAENIQGAADTGWSAIGTEEFSPTSSVFLLTGTESNFLQAEAIARGYMSGSAATFYNAGINASWSEWTNSTAQIANISTYESQAGVNFASASGMQAQLNLILTQKWIAMCGNQSFEGWTEWRRTRIPTGFQVSASSVLGPGQFPRRFVYPSEELLNNTSFPGEALITTPIYWDVN